MRIAHRLFLMAAIIAASLQPAMASTTAQRPEIKERWEVNSGTTNCRLIRHFLSSGESYRLEMTGWIQGRSVGWYVYGEGLPSLGARKAITISLAPSATALDFVTSPQMTAYGAGPFVSWIDENGALLDALSKNQQLSLSGPQKLNFVINVPNAHKAIQAYQTCQDNLVVSWGHDPLSLRSLSEVATPSGNAGRWATNDDYPPADFKRRNEGVVVFVLDVDAVGRTTRCQILESSGFPTLDQRTCDLMMVRAKFHPARNGAGVPVATIYVNRVKWQVPR